ncbi:MAG: hypothetical protein QOD83_3558 [Solirubrobacteraceae bacterium]|nr:hypothetical protein [Solirubrobacteraceae bacterium]
MNAMAQVAQRMTADEYLEVPWDGRRTQLVEGEVIPVEPRNLHQVAPGPSRCAARLDF